jgi:hypothetical protein
MTHRPAVLRIAVASLAAAMLFSGMVACRTSTDEAAAADPAAASVAPVKSALDEQIKQARAEEILDTILTGMKERNHTLYLSHFTSEWKEKITKANFEKMSAAIADELGECQSRQYFGLVNKQILDVFIWKATFNKTDEEAVIRLVLGEVDGQYQVFSFSIAPY